MRKNEICGWKGSKVRKPVYEGDGVENDHASLWLDPHPPIRMKWNTVKFEKYCKMLKLSLLNNLVIGTSDNGMLLLFFLFF